MKAPVFEILKWQAAPNIDDSAMLKAMKAFSEEVMSLSGFLHQSLYKNSQEQWVCVYFWATEKAAHQSNTAVADWPSFHHLMSLIEAETVTMEVLNCLQTQGDLRFDECINDS